MSAIAHGPTIVLLTQPQPSFQRTKGGGFDTGRRRFKCLTADYLTWLQKLFVVGTSDAAVMTAVRAVNGTAQKGHPLMFVSHADIEQQLHGDQCIIAVEFEGLLCAKPGHLQFSTRSEERSEIPQVGGSFNFAPVRLPIQVPTITHRYVTTNGRPNAVKMNTAAVPPGISDQETKNAKAFYSAAFSFGISVFSGWVISTRTSVAPGGIATSSVWDNTDVYQYLDKRAQALI